MTRAHALLLLPLLAVVAPLAADWDASYAARLEENLAYRQALTQLRQAELKAAQEERPYLPYLGVGTSGQFGVSILDGELQASVITTELRFENLLGADLTFAVPLSFGGASPAGLGNPSVTLSRRIFEETQSSLLKARAALIRARASMEKAASDVRLGLVTDILDAYRSVRVVESHRRNLAVLERLREVTRSETDARAVERRILQARRAILQADAALQAMDAEVRANVEALYPEAQERIRTWVRSMPPKGSPAPSSAELEAQRLELEAAERERALAFLPYVPNPTLSASLTYDPDERKLGWRFSVLFSTDVIDRGERATAAFLRREGPAIERMTLESAKKSLERSVASAWTALEVLDVDRQIQALDVEDVRETAKRWQALFSRGFVSEEDLAMVEIDLAVEELDAVEIEHEYVKQQLKLLRYYGSARAEGAR
ncbi:MAG: TolC family protein [Spirochaetes bacterium]|nr:TolC family protein [Spirochaetota bacterium]